MTTKLTLTIEDQVIKTAKRYARRKGKSLSGLVENYLRVLVQEESGPGGSGVRVSRLRGSVRLPEGFDYKEELGRAIQEKGGR